MTNTEIFKKLNTSLQNGNPKTCCFHGPMFITNKDTREHIHQYNLKHRFDNPTPVTNSNVSLPPKRAILSLPAVKSLLIPQNIISNEENENIIDGYKFLFFEK